MSEMFESIAQGLKEAIEYEQGKNIAVKVHQQQEITSIQSLQRLNATVDVPAS